MLDGQTLADLQARKQALVLESELNRLALRIEAGKVRAAGAELREAARLGRRFRTRLLTLASLGGMVLARKFRRRSRFSGLMSVIRCVPSLYALWQDVIAPGRRAGAKPAPTSRPDPPRRETERQP